MRLRGLGGLGRLRKRASGGHDKPQRYLIVFHVCDQAGVTQTKPGTTADVQGIRLFPREGEKGGGSFGAGMTEGHSLVQYKALRALYASITFDKIIIYGNVRGPVRQGRGEGKLGNEVCVVGACLSRSTTEGEHAGRR